MYSEEVQLSAKRKPKYFEWKDRDRLPQKYTVLDSGRYQWSMDKSGQRRLYDTETKSFVIKNAVSVSRPRMMSIAGNEFFPGLHERVRMKVVEHLKSEFQRSFPASLELSFPIRIHEELYTLPKYANWDLDNMWIYTKCFQDALADAKLVPNDNIKFITQSPAPRFIPVTREADRAMVFTLEEDYDPRIREHLLYNMVPIPSHDTKVIIGWLISPSPIGKPGDLALDVDATTFMVNMGRKMDIDKAIKKCLERVHHHCIQMNIREVTIQKSLFNAHVERELCQKGVKVWTLIP